MSAGFLALLDDVATIMSKAAAGLDDVATMAGVGARGASAVVIDDIPVNAQAVTEFEIDAKREVPIVRAIERGSLINKSIAIPLAMVVNSFAPFLLTPILALGGAYLGFEGAEKVIHAVLAKLGKHHEDKENGATTVAKTQEEFETQLVKGAIRTDLVMSIEIIFIALASINDLMPDSHWGMMLITLIIIGYLITKIIYGLVLGLLRLDDLALHLTVTAKENRAGAYKKRLAVWIIRLSPPLMKTMSVVGAAAMLFISGELLSKQFTFISDSVHHITPEFISGPFHFLAYSVVGLTVGAVLIGTMKLAQRAMKDPMPGGG